MQKETGIQVSHGGVSGIPPLHLIFKTNRPPHPHGGEVSGIPLPPFGWIRPPPDHFWVASRTTAPSEYPCKGRSKRCAILHSSQNWEGGYPAYPPSLLFSKRAYPPCMGVGGWHQTPPSAQRPAARPDGLREAGGGRGLPSVNDAIPVLPGHEMCYIVLAKVGGYT